MNNRRGWEFAVEKRNIWSALSSPSIPLRRMTRIPVVNAIQSRLESVLKYGEAAREIKYARENIREN